jgi:hypothetical protein
MPRQAVGMDTSPSRNLSATSFPRSPTSPTGPTQDGHPLSQLQARMSPRVSLASLAESR